MSIDPDLFAQMETMYGIIKADPRWGGSYCIGVCPELKEAAFADITELTLCGDTLSILVSDQIVNVTDGQGNKHSDLWICRLPPVQDTDTPVQNTDTPVQDTGQ